jgi:hypothetical protein
MITGHRGNGAPGPDLAGLENQPTAARSGVAAITAGQTLIRTFGCNSCADNGSANTEISAIWPKRTRPLSSLHPFVAQHPRQQQDSQTGIPTTSTETATSPNQRQLRGAGCGNFRPCPFLQMVLNLKTAKALGLTIPETLLATADGVIQ